MKKALRILITDKVHPHLIHELEQEGHSVEYSPKLSLNNTREIVSDYEGIIINSKTICDQKLIDLGVNLKFIGRLGSGLEIIDLDYAQKKNIKVIRTPEANCHSVAEHVLGMILSLFNNFKLADKQLKNLNWQREENRGLELKGKTIGIIGYGHTGSAFHQLLKPFGVNTIIYDKYKSSYSSINQLEKIKKEANVISIHLPLTPETIGFVNSSFINECSNPFYLVNTARGKNVILKDLIEALDNQKVLGACLDVFDNEKPSSYTSVEKDLYSNLHSRINVISTPHVAGWTHESLLRIAQSILNQIKELHF